MEFPPVIRSMVRPRNAAAAILVCCWLWPGAFLAAQAGERLEDVERALQDNRTRSQELSAKAAALQREIRSLQSKSVAAARKTQDLEGELTAIEDSLADLEAQRSAKAAELQARRGQLYHTLAALQRIAVQPTEALLVGPGTAVDRVRSAVLLKAAIPAIEDRADRLREDLEELASLRAEIRRQRADLDATKADLAEERESLGALLERKKSLRAATLGERERAVARAARLASEAKNLRDLLARLEREARERAERAARQRAAFARQQAERERQEAMRRRSDEAAQAALAEQQALLRDPAPSLERPANVRPFPAQPAASLLVMPVQGRLITAYGQHVTGGQEISKGITLATRARAQVVAPYDGQVVYAGEFRGYGQILIIEHGGRYHTLLAGLERIDAVVGQWILAGEPIGVMGKPQGQNPELYMEFRRTGQPVNPLPWLATTDDKVQG